ncbi:unnamed protein product [Acanthoscelides obtectus]|uniref:Uncharacterized protein n=1 Tax=Acanthoscelides obtectus TaxID=200917 RepID=A0A9P0QK47_ACAOB|nr:unnamed protein product [Acanthoscelides obtectus]CAK1654882.1 hypothetical protein AOBTE_LOCUS18910 [Acanthoscelides obtectus]
MYINRGIPEVCLAKETPSRDAAAAPRRRGRPRKTRDEKVKETLPTRDATAAPHRRERPRKTHDEVSYSHLIAKLTKYGFY